MKKMKNKYFLTISTCILGLCLFLASGCSFISVSLVPPVQPLRETTVMGKGKEKVLIVEISGIISEEEKRGIAGLSGEPDMVARIKEELKTAAKDKKNKIKRNKKVKKKNREQGHCLYYGFGGMGGLLRSRLSRQDCSAPYDRYGQYWRHHAQS